MISWEPKGIPKKNRRPLGGLFKKPLVSLFLGPGYFAISSGGGGIGEGVPLDSHEDRTFLKKKSPLKEAMTP